MVTRTNDKNTEMAFRLLDIVKQRYDRISRSLELEPTPGIISIHYTKPNRTKIILVYITLRSKTGFFSIYFDEGIRMPIRNESDFQQALDAIDQKMRTRLNYS